MGLLLFVSTKILKLHWYQYIGTHLVIMMWHSGLKARKTACKSINQKTVVSDLHVLREVKGLEWNDGGSGYIFSLIFLGSQGDLCCDFDQEAEAGQRHCSRQRFQDVGWWAAGPWSTEQESVFCVPRTNDQIGRTENEREGQTLANNGLCREKETNDRTYLGEKILLTQQSYVYSLRGNDWE